MSYNPIFDSFLSVNFRDNRFRDKIRDNRQVFRENSPHIFRDKLSIEASVFETPVFETNSRYQKLH